MKIKVWKFDSLLIILGAMSSKNFKLTACRNKYNLTKNEYNLSKVYLFWFWTHLTLVYSLHAFKCVVNQVIGISIAKCYA